MGLPLLSKTPAAGPPNHAETPSSTTTWLGQRPLPLRRACAASASTTLHAMSASGSFNLRLSTVNWLQATVDRPQVPQNAHLHENGEGWVQTLSPFRDGRN